MFLIIFQAIVSSSGEVLYGVRERYYRSSGYCMEFANYFRYSGLFEGNSRQFLFLIFQATVSSSGRGNLSPIFMFDFPGYCIEFGREKLSPICIHDVAMLHVCAPRCQVAIVDLGSAAVVTPSCRQFRLRFQTIVSSSGGGNNFYS